MAQAEHVTIFDTTLRDGEQSPGCSMNVAEKVRMAYQLDRLGVDILEAGFPIASEGDFEAVRVLSREIRRPIIAALARSCPGDIERAWRALEGASHPRIHTFLATSDIHLQHKLKISRRQCLEQARPHRYQLPLRSDGGGDRGGRHNPEYSRHGRLQRAP